MKRFEDMGWREEETGADIGKRGEQAACRFLMNMGHTVLERNWRSGHLEIDLITYDRKGIHFVEVKSRRAPVQAEPQDSVGRAKQKRVAMAASRYLAAKNESGLADMECVFDVIAVVFDGDREEITFFPEAWHPIYI